MIMKNKILGVFLLLIPWTLLLFSCNNIDNNDEASISPDGGEKLTREKVENSNLSMHEAMFYEQLSGDKVVCELCPKTCLLKEGETGNCRVRANVDGKLRSLVYSRPVTMHIDPIEKKPFFHFYPETKTLSVATVGCNLHCVNCQNANLSQKSPFNMNKVHKIKPEQLVNIAKKKNSKMISYTYNDPTVFYEYVMETAKLARKEGIKNTLVTAAYINPEPARKLGKYIDAATVDIKGMSDEFYQRFNTGELKPVLKAIEILKEQGVWLEISYLLIPGENDSKADLRKLSLWVYNKLGKETPIHFLRFFPCYKLKSKPATPEETLKKAYNIAKNTGLEHVYIGNLRDPKTENTYCPSCDKKIIDRNGYIILENHVSDGKCDFCGEDINGRW